MPTVLSLCVVERGHGICTDIWSTWRGGGGVLGDTLLWDFGYTRASPSLVTLLPRLVQLPAEFASSRKELLGSQLHHHAASSFPTDKVHLYLLTY